MNNEPMIEITVNADGHVSDVRKDDEELIEGTDYTVFYEDDEESENDTEE